MKPFKKNKKKGLKTFERKYRNHRKTHTHTHTVWSSPHLPRLLQQKTVCRTLCRLIVMMSPTLAVIFIVARCWWRKSLTNFWDTTCGLREITPLNVTNFRHRKNRAVASLTWLCCCDFLVFFASGQSSLSLSPFRQIGLTITVFVNK